jgi:hypothetical protein
MCDGARALDRRSIHLENERRLLRSNSRQLDIRGTECDGEVFEAGAGRRRAEPRLVGVARYYHWSELASARAVKQREALDQLRRVVQL